MIKINVIENESLMEPLNRLISSMLPHEGYKENLAKDVMVQIEKILSVDEMNMEYYVLCSALKEVQKIKATVTGFKTTLIRDVFDNIITNNISDLIRNPKVGLISWLESNNIPSDLNIETGFDLACQKLYERSMELYDLCYAIMQDTDLALNYIPVLKSAYLGVIANEMLKSQAVILNSSLRDGYKRYSGSEDWLRFTLEKLTEIKTKLEHSEDKIITIKDVSQGNKLLEDYQKSLAPITKWDIPPIDDAFPICSHRLIVLVANEGVGKTTMAVNIAGNAMKDNKRVLYLTGESDIPVVWAKFISNYIYKEFGVFITSQHLADKSSLPEDKIKLVNIANATLSKSSVSISKAFSYKTFYTELVSAYEREPFDLVFIDHTLTMRGQGEEYEKVTLLSEALRDFKNEYPVACIVLSHPSSSAKELIAKGKMVSNSPTKASANLSGEADEVFVISDTDMLKKQGLLAIQQYKRRDANPLADYVIIKKKFNVNTYEWDERYQANYGEEEISTESAIENLNSIYEDDDFEDLEDGIEYEYFDDDIEE
ncbi:DnaB-like helicase C-terminal domain-containing protein [uncultured Clostridium sp.]|uniref:DnaB-like helicase C-terminal domain-containing protein n=1 Tax=uncultured Clostridium sp. TaxID=59620 RepID=UPI0026F3F588|nr:DnaB-like helicase C-terminal domain-containing protein [uncultured Clostridium sp.]